MQDREQALAAWARDCIQRASGRDTGPVSLQPVSGDASFRRYFRLSLSPGQPRIPGGDTDSYLLVDAPPEHEDCALFARIAGMLSEAGVAVPRLYDMDAGRGFMLLEDFGDTLYLQCLEQARRDGDSKRIDGLYDRAVETLLRMQERADSRALPLYDGGRLHGEMSLFDQWFCEGLLGLSLSAAERGMIRDLYRFLADAALAQPRVWVHRDYHSRNLMVRGDGEQAAPGVIDFQDAVRGPYTYDLVSLLRDCYIVWPQASVRSRALEYARRAGERGIVPDTGTARFLRDFDLMSMQRHLKVIGIFSRLSLRDGKDRYLGDIPVAIDYVREVAPHYPELNDFLDWFDTRLQPLIADGLAGKRR